MPYRTRSTRAGDSVIELSIPMRLVRGTAADAAVDADDATCYICANAFCGAEECCRSLTHLACCTQSICCGCLLKSSKRCGCKDDCDAVISLCPFCREVSPVEALDVFLGQKAACKACVTLDTTAATTAASAVAAVPPPVASSVDSSSSTPPASPPPPPIESLT